MTEDSRKKKHPRGSAVEGEIDDMNGSMIRWR